MKLHHHIKILHIITTPHFQRKTKLGINLYKPTQPLVSTNVGARAKKVGHAPQQPL